MEVEFDFAGRAVAVFADVQIGQALAVGVGVVHFLAIDKHDQVSVLFDRTGFAQIGELGALVVAIFDGARELRQRQDRDVQFLGEGLEEFPADRQLLSDREIVRKNRP